MREHIELPLITTWGLCRLPFHTAKLYKIFHISWTACSTAREKIGILHTDSKNYTILTLEMSILWRVSLVCISTQDHHLRRLSPQWLELQRRYSSLLVCSSFPVPSSPWLNLHHSCCCCLRQTRQIGQTKQRWTAAYLEAYSVFGNRVVKLYLYV